MKCVRCKSEHIVFNGKYKNGVQRYKCCDCGKQFSELTFRKFYRHRFPPQIITIAIFFHLFIPARIVQIFLFFLFRCYVSKKTICFWTREILDEMPELRFIYNNFNMTIRHTDEKQIKIKNKKAWWWNIVNSEGKSLSSCISWTRHGYAAKKLMKMNKEIYGNPLIMITDKLPAYGKAVNVFGRKCKHITAGIVPKMCMHKGNLLLVSNLAVERFHSKIEHYINMKFRGSFENIESADRWRKAFIFTTCLQETFALQKSFGTFSIASDKRANLRELTVPTQKAL